jgi:hypothetical protein
VVITTPEPPPSTTPPRGTEPATSNTRESRTSLTGGNGLFPPVVITIPQPEKAPARPKTKTSDPVPSATPVEQAENDLDFESSPPEQPAARASRTRLAAENTSKAAAGKKPCTLTVSEENISLQASGRDVAVIVGLEDDTDLDGLTALSTSPADVSVRREIIAGVTGRALFVLRSESSNTGVYQVAFEMPCGRKKIAVNVR